MDIQKYIASGIIEQYVLGLTSEEEGTAVEQAAAQYPEIQQHIEELRNSIEQYALAHAITPPSGLKNKVLQSVDPSRAPVETPTIPSKKGIPFWLGGVLTAAFLTAAIMAGMFYWNNQSQQEKLDQLKTEMATLQENCDLLKNSNQQIIAALKDPNTKHIHLRGTAVSPESLVVAFWNENDEEAYLNVINLPNPPEKHQYQLWADIDGKMVSMGVLDLKGDEVLSIPFMAQAESLNITLEPEGGSEHPNVEQLHVSGEV